MWKSFNSKLLGLISIGLTSTLIASNAVLSPNKKTTNSSENQRNILATKPAVALDQSAINLDHSFLIAADLIDRKQGQAALAKLQGLEQEYPLLAAHILLAQGEAYQLENNYHSAETTWQKLITEYPTSAATGEALYLLGKSNPTYWQQAIAKFPAHPRTHELIKQQLSQNPNQPRLMAVLVKYTPDEPGVDQMRDRLVREYSSQLTPQEWEAIADSYWLKWDYGKAGKAYAKATKSDRNLYRAGRGYHLGNSKVTAKQYYFQLIQQDPDSDYTGWALRRLATIVSKREALTYLDRAIKEFPKHAPEALVVKAEYLKALNSPQSASNALETLLTAVSYTHLTLPTIYSV